MYLVLPLGAFHGWGVCGRNLLRELAGQVAVTHLWPDGDLGGGFDDLEAAYLRRFAMSSEERRRTLADPGVAVPGSVLQSIRDHTMLPGGPYLRGSQTVGYTFFERDVLPESARRVVTDHYDLVVAGSTWCEEILQRHGIPRTATILQGIDPQLFNPAAGEKQIFRDSFVVFSGGKLSLRKGHDIVIRAIKALQDRHRDVLFVHAWFNPWPATMQGLTGSPHIRCDLSGEDHLEITGNLLAANGVDLDRVISVPARSNALMAKIYKNTDLGLFPNRCEGGTNLVLMEYMACGKPVIASLGSGHRDILSCENSRPIKTLGVAEIRHEGGLVTRWDEPDLDETVEHLEWAYQNRDQLLPLGERAAADLSKLTWRRAAGAWLKLLGRDGSE